MVTVMLLGSNLRRATDYHDWIRSSYSLSRRIPAKYLHINHCRPLSDPYLLTFMVILPPPHPQSFETNLFS